MIYILVGLAGVLGAICRYETGLLIVRDGVSSIWATLPINVSGSFVLAAFLCYAETIKPGIHPWVKAGFGTGFLGAFTTFSTLSVELVHFLVTGQYGYAAAYFLASLWGGLAAAGLGWYTVSRIAVSRKGGRPS